MPASGSGVGATSAIACQSSQELLETTSHGGSVDRTACRRRQHHGRRAMDRLAAGRARCRGHQGRAAGRRRHAMGRAAAARAWAPITCASTSTSRAIVLDLKDPADRAAALDLAATADVFMQNFRGGVIDRLGLGYSAVSARNPRIVYCSVSGFGETGPAREGGLRGLHHAGLLRLRAPERAARRRARGVSLHRLHRSHDVDRGDRRRARGAAGARDDRPRAEDRSLDAAGRARDAVHARGRAARRRRVACSARAAQSPGWRRIAPIATLDGEVFVTAHDDGEWRGFCAAIERPDLADGRAVRKNRAAGRNRDALDAIVAPIFAASR